MKKIAIFVIATHAIFLFTMMKYHPVKPKEKKLLAIRMCVQAPPPPSPPPSPPTSPPISSPITPQVTTQKSTPKPSKKPPPKKVVKKITPTKPSSPQIDPNLIKDLQESIAKIEQKSHIGTPKRVLTTPSRVSTLKIDQEGENSFFANELIACLQNSLELPEIGEVKVELTLLRTGHLAKLSILESKSSRNQKFLEAELKTLSYPPFTGTLKNEKEHSFLITFSNH